MLRDAEIERVEEEKRLAIQVKASQQKTDLLKMEEKIAKAKAMEEVYQLEEEYQEQLSGQSNVSKASKSTKSSKRSASSRVSNRSSVAKRDELAGLKAERKLIRQRFRPNSLNAKRQPVQTEIQRT